MRRPDDSKNRESPITMAEYIRGSGWKRQIDSIDKTLLQTVEKVAAAVTESNLGSTKNEKDRKDKVVVQYACTGTPTYIL